MKETAYLLQVVLICAWWCGLVLSDTFFAAFQFEQIGPVAFWSFLLPDLSVIALLSLVRVYRVSSAIEYTILGGFAYGTAYCVNASLMTASGALPTSLMIVGLSYNLLLSCGEGVFRVASSRHAAWNGLKTLLQVICFWMLALVVFPCVVMQAFDELVWPQPGWTTWLGVSLLTVCSVLGLASAYWMVRQGDGTPLPLDQTNRLVVTGPYRFVRNPMAISGLGQGVAIALIFQSLPVLVYCALGGCMWQFVVRPLEEHDLANRFGKAYSQYQRQVGCWLPSWPGFEPRG